MPNFDIALNTLLELKLQTLNTYASIGMTWWVSSIVFCASIISGAWIKRNELKSFPFFTSLSVVLGFFFSSIVLFGIWMIIGIQQLHSEVDVIQAALNVPSHMSGNFTFYSYQVAYGIGTTSFAIILYLWFLLWKAISKEHEKLQKR